MAHTLSANKRIRQGVKRNARNRARKAAVRTEVKKLTAILGKADVAAAAAELKTAQKLLDRTADQGAIHRNTAARRKSKLAKKINALKAQAKA